MKPAAKIPLILLCLLLGLASLQLFRFMLQLIDDSHYAGQRMDVTSQLAEFRLRLEQQLNSTFYSSRGLALLLTSRAASGDEPLLGAYQQNLEAWARETSESLPYLRNISVSTGYILSYVYPLQGNEKVLGTDYRQLPRQWPAVQRAVQSQLPVVAGPLRLVQGGEGVICRIPQYRRDATGHAHFLGMVSMVLDYQLLLRSAGLELAQSSLALAIRGRDGLGAQGALFHGKGSLFNPQSVTQTVQFLGGEWQLAAKPIAGWVYESPYSRRLTVLAYAVSLLIGVLSYHALRGVQQRLQLARQLEFRVEQRTEQLTEAVTQAERANRAKSDFLAVVTHELRTPLNSIIGLTQLTLAMELGARQQQYLDKVSTSASLLLGLINNILSYSKIEAGRDNCYSVAFSPAVLLQKLRDVFEVSASEKSLYFVVEQADDLPAWLLGDEEKILQVLTNLCGNAIKFSDRGEVLLSVSASPCPGDDAEFRRIRFAVVDSGIGIEPAAQEKLFDAFSQVDSGNVGRDQGTGLGLNICKRFVELMGGEIGVDSEPGRGSCFWFEVTLAVAEAPAPDAGRGGLVNPLKGEDVNALVAAATPSLRGMTVVLAEDNLFNRTLALALLERVGVNVRVAVNGAEVLALLEQHPVHAVLMDIQMPKMDGLVATRILRRDPRFTQLPIIAMTANAMAEDRARANEAGMTDFVPKPIDIAVLYRAMVQHMRQDRRFPPQQ